METQIMARFWLVRLCINEIIESLLEGLIEWRLRRLKSALYSRADRFDRLAVYHAELAELHSKLARVAVDNAVKCGIAIREVNEHE